MNSTHSKFFEFISDIKNQRWIVAGLTIFLSLAFFLSGSLRQNSGYPLDDAWIHQTYARNLAQSGNWEFVPGESSAGSTSPLWTMLLSICYLVDLKSPFLWTSLLSIGILTGIALVSNEILQNILKNRPMFGMAASLIIVLDWHLLWSAASGMETLFYCLAGIYIFWILYNGKYWGWLGAVCGIIVWIRPDGITLLGPVLLLIFVYVATRKFSFRDGLFFFLPLVGLLLLYGLFNYSISGSVFPNTFYAKQVEYASVLQQSVFQRLFDVFIVPVAGAGVLLIPGFIYSIIKAFKRIDWWSLSAFAWFFGYGLVYTLRLPMVYQHGRYLFPLIPIFYLLGIIGTQQMILAIKKSEEKSNKICFLFFGTVAVCSLIFAISGRMALKDDINTIERLMVQPALWIRENSPSDAVIAVHDIGAMGYFGNRKIIDLAGLIQPDLIPIIRNEQAIKAYLKQSEADYLVIFKNWYPQLADFGYVEKEFILKTSTFTEIVEIRDLR